MAADQQFCLRWNNHQSTLISVFDTLLENGTLVDCTLAAEGQYLKAHKVVLSACSPYMETLLSQNYDKHPILILKDVKFTELKSMMDYMYRGEVNISQDQLGTFLKAAESLQIKGLSENGEGDARDVGSTNANPPPPRRPPATRPEPEAAQSPAHRSRDGSVSPSSRKRRRLRRNSDDGDNHIESNSCDVPAQSTPVPNIPASITTTPIRTPIVKPEVNDRLDHNTLPAESGLLKEKIEPAEPLLEPKTEYLEDLNNDDSVEDLTLDDDDEMDMSQMSNLSNMSRPGPSHGADLSNQGFPPWQLGNQSGTDEVFMAAQEAVNAHRDSQDTVVEEEECHCINCQQTFPSRARLMAHLRQVSLTEDTEDHCFVCDYPAETLEELQFHLQTFHPQQDLSTIYVCEQCEEHFKTQEDTVCHLKTCRSDPKPTVEEELAEFVEMAKPEDHHYAAEEKETGTTKGKTRMEPKKLIVRQDEPVENEFVRKLREEVSKEIEMEKTDKLINRILKKPPPFKNRIQNNPSPLQKEKAVKESIKNKPVPFSKVSRIFHFFNTKSVEEIKQGYRCPDCGNTCKTYVSAKKHLLEHCNKEPDKCCEFCDYKTKLNTNLKRHIKLVHAAPDLYVCDKCGKDFKKKQLFSHHIRYICESREPEKCSQCDFATKIPGILNSHMFKAHGILKVSDPKEVAKQKDFPDPIKVDEGFKCPDCHRIYAVPDNYKKHRLLSCRQVCNAVKCMVESCQFKTNNYYNLRNHMRRVHFLFAKCKNFELFDLVDREEEV